MGNTSAEQCNGWDSSGCQGTPYCQPRCPRFVDKTGRAWTFRVGTDDDIDDLLEMYRAFDSADRAQGIPPSVDHRCRSWLETLCAEGHNIVAEGQNRLVGHVVFTAADDPEPELAVFVHPDYHNRGIGTELCKQAAAAAVEAGCETLMLHVEQKNRAAVAVYESLGFETVDGEFGLEMALSLDEATAEAVCAPPAHESQLV